MKTTKILKLLLISFLLISCNESDLGIEDINMDTTQTQYSKTSTVANEYETYYFGYELTSGNKDFLKIQFQDLSGDSSNEVHIQVMSNHPSSYKHTFQKFQIDDDSWILWVHTNHELITITTTKSAKVSWKISDTVEPQTLNNSNYWALIFPIIYDKEVSVNNNEELIIKENGIFK